MLVLGSNAHTHVEKHQYGHGEHKPFGHLNDVKGWYIARYGWSPAIHGFWRNSLPTG